jgi:hypothetical protein
MGRRWPKADEDILARLLALNLERAGKGAATLLPEPDPDEAEV